MFDLIVSHDTLLRRIDQEKSSRLQTAFIRDLFLCHRYRSRFRAQHYPVVLRHIVTGRTQTVTVQHAAYHCTVAEADGRRTVPWLHHKGLVTVKVLFLLRHGRILLPGFGDHGDHGMRHGVPGHHQVLQTIIEHGGITAGIIHHREYLFHIREVWRLGLAFPCIQPVDVAPYGIDFPIVHDVPVGMGPCPAGEGVGAETGMHQRHGRCKIQIG